MVSLFKASLLPTQKVTFDLSKVHLQDVSLTMAGDDMMLNFGMF